MQKRKKLNTFYDLCRWPRPEHEELILYRPPASLLVDFKTYNYDLPGCGLKLVHQNSPRWL